jgi:hypothetical protein
MDNMLRSAFAKPMICTREHILMLVIALTKR